MPLIVLLRATGKEPERYWKFAPKEGSRSWKPAGTWTDGSASGPERKGASGVNPLRFGDRSNYSSRIRSISVYFEGLAGISMRRNCDQAMP